MAALDALQRSELLDTAPEDRFDRITSLVRDVLEVPTALVSLVDDARQFFVSASGLSEPWATTRETPLSHSFCKHVVASDKPLIVTNAETDPRVIDNLAVRDLGVCAYLGVPVHVEGHAVGALCAIDTQPRLWKATAVERMVAFGAIIDEQIKMRALVRERDAALRETELLSHEHSHRIKNSLAVAASLVAISASETDSKDDVVRIARERISALSTAQNLAWLRKRGSELSELLKAILAPYRLADDSLVTFTGRTIELPISKITPISLIFHELATNASKYGALSRVGGSVAVTGEVVDGHLLAHWIETLGADGRTRSGDDAAQGFGSRLIDLCVRQLSGSIEIAEGSDGGRRVCLTLPWIGA